MKSFELSTEGAMFICATEPKPQIRNRETGELATDRETGATLYDVGLTKIQDGQAEVITVSVPESGVPAGLTLGQFVAVTKLSGFHWEGHGPKGHRCNIMLRSQALTVVAAPGSAVA